MLRKFTTTELSLSQNRFIQALKWKNWLCSPKEDFDYDSNVLIKDARRNLKFNGQSFRESIFYKELPDSLRQSAESSDLTLIEPAFKQFLRTTLFTNLTDKEFESEYKRLKAAYGQPVLGGAIHAVNDSACKRFLKHPRCDEITVSLVSEKKEDNVTYKYGVFTLQTILTNLIYTYADAKLFSEPYQVTLPTIIIYSCNMTDIQQCFGLDFISTNNLYGELLLFEASINVKQIVDLEKELTEQKIIQQRFEACENYQEDLKESLFSILLREDPAIAFFFKNPVLALPIEQYIKKFDENNSAQDQRQSEVDLNKNKTERIGLDDLINSQNLDDLIKLFSKPSRLAIKKYKALHNIQNTLTVAGQLTIDKIRNFNQLCADHEKLLLTSRDTTVITFFKIVGSVATFGGAAKFLFKTRGHSFIEEVSMFRPTHSIAEIRSAFQYVRPNYGRFSSSI